MNPVDTGALNLAFADAFVAGLAAAGLRHAVLAPGARSSPLAVALLRRPEIACEVLTDERVAGYFALGLAKAGGRPVAVVCTSGTAAANLMPAIMEASLGGVPLLTLTADRPPEAHGWGANQTADQTRLYGSHARAFHALPVPDPAVDATVNNTFAHTMAARLLEECRVPVPGPVHANLPFREPLLPAAIAAPPPLPPAIGMLQPVPGFGDAASLAQRLSNRPGVILCGELPARPGFADSMATLAARLGAPILAEPLSNLRHGPHDLSHVLTRQARFLRQPEAFRPEWVLRFGRFPVSRVLERWLASLADAGHLLVAPAGSWPDPLRRADTVIRCEPQAVVDALLAQPLAPAPAAWFAHWRAADDAAVPADGPRFEGTVARTLVEALPPGAHCFVGNSLAIRAMDAFGGTSDKPLTLYGNRGASGIDGNLATAAGVATGTGAPTAVLLGDQAALHDCGGLLALAARNVVAVVMDNGGGGIFEHLPMARALPAELLARGWLAPNAVDFRSLAGAFGLAYSEVAGRDDLAAALRAAFAGGGPHLVRVAIDRAVSRSCW